MDPGLGAREIGDRENPVLEAVQDLPDDATVEDVMERLYFLIKVDERLRQAEAGETVSHEEAERRILG
jgi:predicted transcriptional regulator